MEKTDQDIALIRKENLIRVRNTDYRGSNKMLSDAIGINITKYVSSSKSSRPISERKARQFEAALGLPIKSLDEPPHEIQSIYYIMLKVVGNYAADTAKLLKGFPEVQECSAILGDFDLFVKVEIRQKKFVEVVIDRMAKMPGVLRTRSYQSIDSIHWQRQQPKSFRIDKPIHSEHSFAETFIRKRINNQLKELKNIEKTGEIIVDDKDGRFNRIKMLSSVKKELLAVRLTHDPRQYKPDYFNAEKKLMENEGIKLKRLFVRSKKVLLKDHNEISEQAQQLISIGCKVKFLIESEWQQNECNTMPEDFGVIDGQFVYVRHESARKATIKTQEESVKHYMHSFNANWRNAMSFKEFEEFLFNEG